MAKKRYEITVEDVSSALDYKPEDGVFIRKVVSGSGRAGEVAGTLFDSGARQIKLLGVDFMDYNLAWFVTHGQHPVGKILHLDGDHGNCRIANLYDMEPGELTHALLTTLLDYSPDTGIFTRKIATGSQSAVGDVVGGELLSGYLSIGVMSKAYLAHRLAWFYVHGEWPSQQIDHLNGNRLDNRIENLRDVSRSINCQNKREALTSNKSSGLLGVNWCNQMRKYRAYITVGGKRTILGYFDGKFEAQEAYIKAKREMHPGCTI